MSTDGHYGEFRKLQGNVELYRPKREYRWFHIGHIEGIKFSTGANEDETIDSGTLRKSRYKNHQKSCVNTLAIFDHFVFLGGDAIHSSNRYIDICIRYHYITLHCIHYIW